MDKKRSNLDASEPEAKHLITVNNELLKEEDWYNRQIQHYQDSSVEDENFAEALMFISEEADVLLEEFFTHMKERQKCPNCNEEYNEQVDAEGQYVICLCGQEYFHEPRISE